MTRKELAARIILMQSDIRENIEYINNGGCIHFAYFFSKALKDLKIPHTVLFFNPGPIYTTYSTFESVSHVMVKIGRVGIIDGLRTYDSSFSYSKNKKELSLSLNRLRKEYEWNFLYDTKQNRKLNKIIRKYINDNRRRRF